MKNIKYNIQNVILLVFLLISFIGNAQKAKDCIDFEDGNNSNWFGFGLSSQPDVTTPNPNDSNPTSYLSFTDGSGGSVAVNYKDFNGNWLLKGKDGCICFDYRVNWKSSVGTTHTGPSVAIFQDLTSPILNSQQDYTSLLHAQNPHQSRIYAFFVANSSSPIQNNIWAHYCLPITKATGTSLPSNSYGTWKIRKGANSTALLTGSVAVTAWNLLITNVTGLLLDSDYNGSPSEVVSFDNFCWNCVGNTQPASVPCCDIPDFEASLIENNGNFSININGGAVPIQEVEISMMDYHVDYSNKDCKPDDMGNFGILSSSTTSLQTLLLNTNDNNTSSLTWLLGSPAVINSNIQLNIVDPLTLNLDCCKVTYSFCLKVRVKDVNCNVCEKIICYTPPKPTCDIKLDNKGIKKKYCIGDTIPISWTGTSPSGLVNIYLIDKTNWVTYQTIATGLPDTGSYNFTIPTNIPCKPIRSWQFYIEDSQKNCYNYGSSFVIDCCQQTGCDCGKWKTNFVTINEKIKPINTPKVKKIIPPYLGLKVACGDTIRLKAFSFFSFKAPVYNCATANCNASYKWKLYKNNGKMKSGTGKTFSHNFNTYGIYKIVFTPSCGSKTCSSCQINVIVEKKVSIGPNNNPGDYIGNQYKGEVTNPKTGRTWMDRNLGASHVATSSTDSLAFGDLYQWGRLTDGHEKRTSGTTANLSSSDDPGHGNFIMSNNGDWRILDNNNLWQGVNGINNPCPSGFRLPTSAELNAERLSWITNDAAGAFASPLKWVLAGDRITNGTILHINSRGIYFSSSIYLPYANSNKVLEIKNNNSHITNTEKSYGFSVRCIKD
ncbi:MAG: hypothetical protein L3J45_07105 [Flavobacteriaceae bacterium]|nr:hypothetical protein [Flavobacteriaceae bacterium]